MEEFSSCCVVVVVLTDSGDGDLEIATFRTFDFGDGCWLGECAISKTCVILLV